jgi:hypothetical protein
MDGQLAGASTEGMAGADWSTAQRLFTSTAQRLVTQSGSEIQGVWESFGNMRQAHSMA